MSRNTMSDQRSPSNSTVILIGHPERPSGTDRLAAGVHPKSNGVMQPVYATLESGCKAQSEGVGGDNAVDLFNDRVGELRLVSRDEFKSEGHKPRG